MADFDLAIIGGGINGAGIARDAAGRGLKVLLVEQNDLASATSSASTKLIHGGLRYLEHYAFRLVREALMEREVLLRMAPHLIRPMRFVLPHHKGIRPAWLLRLGLFIYDHLGGRKLLPPTATIDLTASPLGKPLKPEYVKAFEYSDGWVDDARLVVLNALDASERGASIRTRTACTHAERHSDHWRLTLVAGARSEEATARILINAAGPWVANVVQHVIRANETAPIRLVKGSHIVVPRLYDHDRAYFFQNADGRLVFTIPYEHAFTMIGTTDIDYQGDPGGPQASDDEVKYLCALASDYFRKPVSPSDVVWRFSGVRPLYDDGASKAKDATRDYVLALDDKGGAPMLSIYGGKITTYRRLAEEALEKLEDHTKATKAWTAASHLPGGDFAWDGVPQIVAQLRQRFPFLGEQHALRLARAYGTRAEKVLDGATEDRAFGGLITEAEVRYLMRTEWASEPEDILWRRTKLGLHQTQEQKSALADFMLAEAGRRAAS
ncbi:aerobic glycerol-3-phosphate dehydrogenase [Variibacter gotjawalensis]|uniref:Glycerol-3-phosphate dehydrogenase n=1 Tax=Variibacter gotjawalensis TaxID=1333996 RepID=A0A0S3PPU6_9BRAD|nr:glycerol-3-phosphate dehydrogenase [Variibacter gotjawalensis]NIK48244.1 glycerol-3-phosphate dehydrogenase [Variibacter gotjawalensis]RZS50116.1 homodimeric glycerol 3-phosphate dehydrogenase (quinone) [Variibacter gotjawalensis]BAT57946.1 aerobic glycerol-3-phosphate dehydrogenase [Variibacter gotjawalensis]